MFRNEQLSWTKPLVIWFNKLLIRIKCIDDVINIRFGRWNYCYKYFSLIRPEWNKCQWVTNELKWKKRKQYSIWKLYWHVISAHRIYYALKSFLFIISHNKKKRQNIEGEPNRKKKQYFETVACVGKVEFTQRYTCNDLVQTYCRKLEWEFDSLSSIQIVYYFFFSFSNKQNQNKWRCK